MTTAKTQIRAALPEAGTTKLFLAGALSLFLVFTFQNLGKPFSADESWFMIGAHNYAATGALSTEMLIHPPLYPLVNGSLLKLFQNLAVLKLLGVALGLGSIALMFFLGRACGAGKLRSSLAALLLGVSPLFIQGSLLLDTDNTLVTFFLLAMLLAVFKERWLFFCSAFMLCLWSKMTASLPIFFVFSVWAGWELFNGRRRGAAILVSLVVGLALFLISFRIFCGFTGLPFGMPFEYLCSAFFSKHVSGSGAVLRQARQFALWAGLPLCLLWTAAAIKAIGAGKNNLDMLAVLFSVVIGAGYFFVGGTPYGFPKLQVPAFTLGCWLISGLIVESLMELKEKPVLAAVCLLGGAAAVAAAGDPIYTLRYLIRGAIAAGQGTSGLIAAFGAQVAVPLLLAGLFWLLLRKARIPSGRLVLASLALACFSQLLGMDMLQSRSYNTLYTYGATGEEEAVKLAAAALENGGEAALPQEIPYYLRLRGIAVNNTPNWFWSDTGAIRAAVSCPDYKVIMYGVPFNTLEQLRVLTSGGTAAALTAGGWHKKIAGAYEVWTRADNKK